MPKNKLREQVTQILEDMKAIDIVALDVRKLTEITDTMIICSGTSSRHTQAMAERVMTEQKEKGLPVLGVEGTDTGEWILVDLGDVVVHIMLAATREFYSLEKLWGATRHLRSERNAD